MRIVIQRVSRASVTIDSVVHAATEAGMMVLVGVEKGDSIADADWLADKTAALRIFDDDAGVMNRSIVDVGGDVLAISQFTLLAMTAKGNRPSYFRAAPGPEGKPLYDRYCDRLGQKISGQMGRGVFGADMKVELVNDGPVTIIIDSRNKE